MRRLVLVLMLVLVVSFSIAISKITFAVESRLGMHVYAPDGHGGYAPTWGVPDMHRGSPAVAWLPVTMNGDGKTQIVQLWDPATATLTASPTSIMCGQSSTLSWSSINASLCTGTNFSTGNATSSPGVSVSPTETTSYSVSCTGTKPVSATATVSVTYSTPRIIDPVHVTPIVGDDEYMHVSWVIQDSGPSCCKIKIVGPITTYDNLQSSQDVLRDTNQDYPWKLIVQCGDKQDSRTFMIPKSPPQQPPPQQQNYCFKVKVVDPYTHCETRDYKAGSQPDAAKAATHEACGGADTCPPSISVDPIDCSQMETACSQ